MGQEFTIKSQAIEDKINQLLPSQGGFQPGVDFSASTMVIPIVDLTETAEGSALRQDLQSALSLTSNTAFNVNNTTTTIISTTGYFRIFGTASQGSLNVTKEGSINITDGITSKKVYGLTSFTGGENSIAVPMDFIVFVKAGDSVTITADLNTFFMGSTRQIADINGNLISPL
jgi:hypothetical protein